MSRRSILPFALAVVAFAIAGCSGVHIPRAIARQEALYTPVNFSAENPLPSTLRRVVLLPLDRDGHATPENAIELDSILLSSLQKQARFEVVRLSRADCRRLFGEESFNSTSALPAGFLEKIGSEFSAGAVLFVDLTAHRAYRPQALGLRAKLATVDDARILWAFDEVISAGSPEVAAAVEKKFNDPKAPFDLGAAALQSPGKFGAFAADAMFATLPVR
jgi:hypothetical protein